MDFQIKVQSTVEVCIDKCQVLMLFLNINKDKAEIINQIEMLNGIFIITLVIK